MCHPRVLFNRRTLNCTKGRATSISPAPQIMRQKSTSSATPKPPPRTRFHPVHTLQTPHTPADNLPKRATTMPTKKSQYKEIPWTSRGPNILLPCNWRHLQNPLQGQGSILSTPVKYHKPQQTTYPNTLQNPGTTKTQY